MISKGVGGILRTIRENLDDKEGQTDSTPVDKYQFTWTTKGVRCYLEFHL